MCLFLRKINKKYFYYQQQFAFNHFREQWNVFSFIFISDQFLGNFFSNHSIFTKQTEFKRILISSKWLLGLLGLTHMQLGLVKVTLNEMAKTMRLFARGLLIIKYAWPKKIIIKHEPMWVLYNQAMYHFYRVNQY